MSPLKRRPSLLTAVWVRGVAEFEDWANTMVPDLPPGAEVGLYHLVGGGEDMRRLGEALGRLDMGIPHEPTHLMLVRTDDAASAFDVADLDGDEVVARALYAAVAAADGPEDDQTVGFAPAIQFGTFSMSDVNAEWEVARWYHSLRLPEFEVTPGAVRATRYVSVAGPAKFAILYEFVSLDARLEYFERKQEIHALDSSHPTGAVVARTRHAPMSPSIGYLVV